MTELHLRAVTVRMRGKALLENVDFSVKAGEFVAIVGPNGAGKTTLLRAALGLARPNRGEVLVDGVAIRHLAARSRAAALAYLPQDLRASEALPAIEVVTSARYRFDESADAARRAGLRALERLGVAAFAERPLDRLSGGERQRVMLAALVAQEARLLLLDEPGNHLDPSHQIETYRLLGELSREGLGIVTVTHDVNLLMHAASASPIRIVGLRGGQVAFETAYDDLVLSERLSDLFRVAIKPLNVDGTRWFLPVRESRP